ncbi:MAG TPA: ABC transporter permease subunit [Candidatus Aminicenantes bacterium]|nr:ABC transporter permease subunit [Candidatus Aminicenantes bacterium]HRY64964.1 ABC transporter permease subunit [Candidatus Aminicenantes bacterium]HRZ71877.1 ABC transporter permease subunit [Candidatus Aminicenantes bacterium]
MLRDIIRKEILDNITSPKFVFTFLLCTILILLSVYTGVTNYRAEKKEYTASLALNKKNMEAQPNYNSLAGIGIKVSKPPQVLGTVVTGIEEAVGRVAPVNIAADPDLIESKYGSNPVFAVFGALDLMFIVKIVLSLFAILFTYDAIVGEKEKGTLKLALSNDLPRDRLILGKAIGGYISLLLPLLIPLLLSLIFLIVMPDISLGGQDWGRLLLIFLMFFLYLSVFFSLGLFVSARTSRSSTSFLVLLFAWVVIVMVIPKAAVITAAQARPIPSVHEITAKKDAYLQQIQVEGQKSVRDWVTKNQADAAKDPKAWQDKFRQYLQDYQQELTNKIDQNNAALERDYQQKKRAQQNLAVNLSRISPASALTFGSMTLARTGVDEYDRFLASVRAYKPIYTKWINSKLGQSINFQTGEQAKISLDDMPQHVYEQEWLSRSFVRAVPDFVLLAVLIIAFFVGAYVSFLRYDVR